MVGDAPADRVEDDALDGADPSCGWHPIAGAVEVVRLEHLKLQRNRKAVLWPANAAADQALPGFDARPHDQLLEAGEVVAAVRITGRSLRPSLPPVRGLVAYCACGVLARLGDDAPAHRVIDDRGEGARGIGVVPHQVARDVAQVRDGPGIGRVRVARSAGPPAGAPTGGGGLEVPVQDRTGDPGPPPAERPDGR